MNSCKFISESELPTKFGDFTISAFEEPNGKDHLALTIGDVEQQDAVMCRVHSECLTGDALHSLRCDCGPQLQAALQMLAENKSGILLYLRQEGRGIGLKGRTIKIPRPRFFNICCSWELAILSSSSETEPSANLM
ncbi:hypothetical protein OAC49_02700 [Gammaproteobacteria bacterium]|nr:hypothetical protein [Gammaproteobacteria bacterium]